jgi:hypothetical protein
MDKYDTVSPFIKEVRDINGSVYHVKDNEVIQEFFTLQEAKEFVRYIQNPKAYISKLGVAK